MSTVVSTHSARPAANNGGRGGLSTPFTASGSKAPVMVVTPKTKELEKAMPRRVKVRPQAAPPSPQISPQPYAAIQWERGTCAAWLQNAAGTNAAHNRGNSRLAVTACATHICSQRHCRRCLTGRANAA